MWWRRMVGANDDMGGGTRCSSARGVVMPLSDNLVSGSREDFLDGVAIGMTEFLLHIRDAV